MDTNNFVTIIEKMIASKTNPYVFVAGGTIRGDYNFKNADVSVSGGGTIRLTEDTRIQKQSNAEMYLSFGEFETNLSGDVHVSGLITADNLVQAGNLLPANPAFDSMTTKTINGNSSHNSGAVEFTGGLVATDTTNGVRSNNYKA